MFESSGVVNDLDIFSTISELISIVGPSIVEPYELELRVGCLGNKR